MGIETATEINEQISETHSEIGPEPITTTDSSEQTEKESSSVIETIKNELSEESDKAEALIGMPLETAENAEETTGESFSEEKTKLEELKNELENISNEPPESSEKVSEIFESTETVEKSPEKVGAQRLTEFVIGNMDRLKDPDMRATYGIRAIQKINRMSEKSFAEAATNPNLENTGADVSSESSDSDNENETELFANSIKTMSKTARELRGDDLETHRDDLIEEKATIAAEVVKNLNEHESEDGSALVAFTVGLKKDRLGRATAEKLAPHLDKDTQETLGTIIGVRKEPEDNKVLESMAPYLDEDVKTVLNIE